MPAIVLVGNKTDLIDEEEVRYEEAKGMVKPGWGFVYSSAKDHKNIDQVFLKVIELVVSAETKVEQEKDRKL
jgi:GTPase SAR1 family protein